MRKEQVFLEIARRDLQSSEFLLEKETYPQFVFLLEQGIEKALKSLALRHHIITEEEARGKIQHQLLMIYRIVLDKWQNDLRTFQWVSTAQPDFGRLMVQIYRRPVVRYWTRIVRDFAKAQSKFENRKEAERLAFSRKRLLGYSRRYREGRAALDNLLRTLGGKKYANALKNIVVGEFGRVMDAFLAFIPVARRLLFWKFVGNLFDISAVLFEGVTAFFRECKCRMWLSLDELFGYFDISSVF